MNEQTERTAAEEQKEHGAEDDRAAAVGNTLSYLRSITEDEDLRARFMGAPKDLHEFIRCLADTRELCPGADEASGGVIILPAAEE